MELTELIELIEFLAIVMTTVGLQKSNLKSVTVDTLINSCISIAASLVLSLTRVTSHNEAGAKVHRRCWSGKLKVLALVAARFVERQPWQTPLMFLRLALPVGSEYLLIFAVSG
jgi:hypothetical protein